MRYDVFISYRHTEPDRDRAKWLHRALENYRIPRSLRMQYDLPRSLTRVFRDEEELAASSDLSKEIEEALYESKFLIVVCSPRTPQSEWVNQEVVRFRKLGRNDHILALLIEGEPSESFPRALCEIRQTMVDDHGRLVTAHKEVEPLAADIRPSPSESNTHRFRMAKLRLLAAILGCHFDDLRQREHERRIRRFAFAGVVMGILALVMAGLSVFAFYQWGRAETALAGEAAEKHRAELGEHISSVGLAYAEWGNNNILQCEKRIADTKVELRSWEVGYLQHLCNAEHLALRGHTDAVICVSWLPNQRIVTGSRDGTIRIWNAKSGEQERVVKLKSQRPIESWQQRPMLAPIQLFAANDGQSVLSVSMERNSSDYSIDLIDVTTGKRQNWAFGGGSKDPLLAVSRDERVAVDLTNRSLGHLNDLIDHGLDHFNQEDPPRVEIRELRSDRILQRLLTQVVEKQANKTTVVSDLATSLRFSPDSTRLAVGMSEGSVQLFETATGRRTSILTGLPTKDDFLTMSIDSLDFHRSQSQLVAGFRGGTVRVWDIQENRIRVEHRHNGRVSTVRFSAKGDRFASASWDTSIQVYDHATGRRTNVIRGHRARIHDMAFDPTGEFLVSASGDSTAKVWRVDEQQERRSLIGHKGWVKSVAFSPDGRQLISGSSDDTLKLWDVQTGQVQRTLQGHSDFIKSVAFSPDGKLVASGSADETAGIWSLATGQNKFGPLKHSDWVEDVEFSPDGKMLATASGPVTVWSIEDGSKIAEWPRPASSFGSSSNVECIRFHPRQNLLAVVAGSRVVFLDASTREKSNDLGIIKCSHQVNCLAFNSDGSLLATAGHDAEARVMQLWNPTTGACLWTANGHERQVFDVAFTHDDRRVVTASQDSTIKLWDAASGREVLTRLGHELSVNSVAFSPDGSTLASASDDEAIHLRLATFSTQD